MRLRTSLLILFVSLLLLEGDAWAKRRSYRKGRRPASVTTKKKKAAVRKKNSLITTKIKKPVYKYRFNFLMGMHVINKRFGLISGGQLAMLVSKKKDIYVGPEVSLTLFENGTLITPLIGLWYDIEIPETKGMYFSLGALAGLSVPDQFVPVPSAGFAGFIELILTQQLSDLVSVRGQIRPGFVRDRFAFMSNLNLSFRFQ